MSNKCHIRTKVEKGMLIGAIIQKEHAEKDGDVRFVFEEFNVDMFYMFFAFYVI